MKVTRRGVPRWSFAEDKDDGELSFFPALLDARLPQHRSSAFPRSDEILPKQVQYPGSFEYQIRRDERSGELRSFEFHRPGGDVGEKSLSQTSLWVAVRVAQQPAQCQ